MANADITKADRIWRAVGMKIRSSCGEQKFYDYGTHRLRLSLRSGALLQPASTNVANKTTRYRMILLGCYTSRN